MFDIRQRPDRGIEAVASLLADVETATLGHLLAHGFMLPAIQQVNEGSRICGPALTVSVPPDDGAILAHAVGPGGTRRRHRGGTAGR